MTTTTGDNVDIFWHRELPPLAAEPMGEHFVEAISKRIKGDLAHRDELWDRCYDDHMATRARACSRKSSVSAVTMRTSGRNH